MRPDCEDCTARKKLSDQIGPVCTRDLEDATDVEVPSAESETECEAPTPGGWLVQWTLEEVLKQQEKDPHIGIVREWVLSNHPRPSKDELLSYRAEVRAICVWWPRLVIKVGLLY